MKKSKKSTALARFTDIGRIWPSRKPSAFGLIKKSLVAAPIVASAGRQLSRMTPKTTKSAVKYAAAALLLGGAGAGLYAYYKKTRAAGAAIG